ncbi:MAG: PAS domain-containing protein [Lachnospiraceae bacterium]|nr:PAS domain-containing protein [Lachnospiraceae bacterium]
MDSAVERVILEKSVNCSTVVFCRLYIKNEWKLEYISKNINQYGYTSQELYEGRVSWTSLIHPDDFERFTNVVYENIQQGISDFYREYRIVTESRETISVTDHVHVTRDKYGNPECIDMAIMNNTAYKNREIQFGFLESAVMKSKYVVMVRRINGPDTHVLYVSPNISQYGIRIHDIWQGPSGLKRLLTEEDYEMVENTMWSAINSHATRYKCRFHVKNNEDRIIWAQADNIITYESDDSITVETILMDITDERRREVSISEENVKLKGQLDAVLQEEEINEIDFVHTFSSDVMQDIVETFAKLSGLYTAAVDRAGKLICPPQGPMTYMGEFYDIFEYPKYKQTIQEACEKQMKEVVPTFVELSQKVSGAKFALLPILVKEYHIATFVIGCYTSQQYDHLQDSLGSVISYVKSISDNIYSGVVKTREAERIKMAEILLKEDLKRSQIETEILDRINMVEDSEANFHAIFDTVGRYLEFNKIVFFRFESTHIERGTKGHVVYEWKDEKERKEEMIFEDDFTTNRVRLERDGYIALNKDNLSPKDAQHFERFGMDALLILPVVQYGKQIGCIAFFEFEKHRVFDDTTIQFCKNITNMVQGVLVRKHQKELANATTRMLLSAFDDVDECMYVRDMENCRILYANEKAKEIFGDIVGKTCHEVIEVDPAACDACAKYQNTKKTDIYEKDFFNKSLNKIMKLKEMSIQWTDGRDARLVVMKEI